MAKDTYIISTDSSADLTQDDIKKTGIEVIPLELTFDGKIYVKEDQLKIERFYRDVTKGNVPKTTQINSSRYKEYFEAFLKKGVSVLHISFSSGLSGTHYQAVLAAKELNEKYPNCKVLVVDSLCASVGQGLLAYYAFCKKKRENCTLLELFNWINETRLRINHFFTVEDLFYLKKGGRISTTAAVVGSLLSIKPVLTINLTGKISILAKARGTKAIIDFLVNKTKEQLTADKDFGKIIVAHTQNLNAANDLKCSLKKNLNSTNTLIKYIGPSVGAHLGAGAVAVAFLGLERTI